MNRAAILNKVTSARAAKSFRKQVDFKLPRKYESRPHGMTNASCLVSSTGFAHGIPNGVQSSIKGLVEGNFYEAMETGTVTHFIVS